MKRSQILKGESILMHPTGTRSINNKKGSALALVIVIAAALTILVGAAFLMAESSISAADSGIKSREAYLSSKSGIEFIKSHVAGTMQDAQSHLNSQVAMKNSDPDHVVAPLDDDTLYGYGSLDNGFTMNASISESTPAYEDARIRIVYSVEYDLDFTETDSETGAGTYEVHVRITGSSLGKSPEASRFTDIFEKGVPLTYEYEDGVTANYAGEEGSSEGDIPTLPGEPYIPVTDEWIIDEETGETGTGLMYHDTTFYYDGNHYLVLWNSWITPGTQPSDYPHIVLINPAFARNIDGWNGVPPYNNKSLASFNLWLHQRDGGPNIQRGDKVVYNGIYYILRDEANTIDWVQNPLEGNGYPWFIIPNQ